MAMIRHSRSVGSGLSIRLLYSARSLGDIIYRDELDEETRNRFQVFYTLTRERPPGWPGYSRRVDLQMLSEVCWPPHQAPLVYVCGPTAFVESVAEALVELGHDPGQIRTERFGPTGR
jgi:ferredoxin-NADP reductase